MAVGKISGAVGNASHLGPEMEERICQRLGLNVAPVASQVIQRDRHAHYLSSLALIAALLEKIALEIRHCSAPKSAKRRNPSAVSSAAVRRCRTSATRSLPNRFAASPGWCVRT